MDKEFTVRFWGVRGSYPVPGNQTLIFGGNTTCVEITVRNLTIIIDAGTGIVELGKKIVGEYFASQSKDPLELTILFTHLHHDHTQGLPFFAPLYIGNSILHLFGPRYFGEELSMALERSMIPPNFPVDFFQSNSHKQIHTIKESHIIVINPENKKPQLFNRFHDSFETNESSVLIKIMNDYSHPANGVLIYRIDYGKKSMVFSTDVEGYLYGNSKLANFAKDTDLLIHDAQYTKEEYIALPTPKQGFGHSIPEMAIEVARLSNAKNLILTHHDPNTPDAVLKKRQTKYRRRFKNLQYAKEGLAISL